MNEPKQYFDERNHAEVYRKYRSEMPPQMVQKILSFLKEKLDPSECIGVDIGCGSGQSTFPFAPFLKKIIGFDSSAAQIEQVKAINDIGNIEFRHNCAESIPLPDSSVHLVTTMNAAHWFNLPSFLKEADRVLVSNGVIAISLGLGMRMIEVIGHEDASRRLSQKLHDETISYWDERLKIADNLYRDITLPYEEVLRDESIVMEEELTVSDLMGRTRSLSGIAAFYKDSPQEAEKLLLKFQEDLMEMIGSNESTGQTMITIRRPFATLLGRKP